MRAAKRPAILRKNDTTWSKGCTAAQVGECIYGSWYLIEPAHEKVLRGPEETEKNLYADKLQTAGRREGQGGARQPRDRARAGDADRQRETGKVTDKSPNSYYVINDDPVLTGADMKNPTQSFDEGSGGTGAPNVTFDFTGHGKSVFERVTKEIAHRGQEAQLPGVPKEAALQHFAIVLDGQVITAPSIDYTKYPEGIDATTGSEISGGFTITSAQELAQELQSGALPIKLQLISNSQVSATLGKTALNQGLIAGLVGFAIVCLFLLLFYRVLGAIAIGGLLIYGIYFFALIKLIPITLTLPGIAGLILTIGVAADANIVIFERVKEEIRGGRSIISGIATGYKRGFEAIVDANVVTFMTAFILFALATAEVKGFAFVLGIGTLVSLFTAVLATQAALGAMGRSKLVAHRSALGAERRGKGWTFDFMGASKWFFSLSGTILLIGALAIGGKGLNFGIDFKSGTRIQTAFVHPVAESKVEAVMRSAGYSNAEIQKFNEQEHRRLRLPDLDGDAEAGQRPEDQGRPRQASFGTTELLVDLDRADVRQNDREQRDHRDHRLAAGDLGLHRAALLLEVLDSGADRADARSADHRRRLLADRARSDDLDGRRPVDDPRLLAVRHDHRVRSCARERAADAACGVLADRQPLDVRGADQIAGDELLHAAAGALAAAVRRRNAEGLRLRADGRHRLRRVLLDLHRLAGADALEGARADLPQPARADRARTRRRACLRDGARRRTDRHRAIREARRTRRGSLIAPEEPGEQISRDEFQELVRDLDVDGEPSAPNGGGSSTRRSRAGGVAQKQARNKPREQVEPEREQDGSQEPAADPAADLTPEDLVLKDDPKPRTKRNKGPRNRRHGRR